jgi:hypothetical protein
MLGELLGEVKGKIVVRRVLKPEGSEQRVEVSIQGQGKLAGTEVTEIGTYTSSLKPGGFLSGSGQGIMMTKDGGMIAWSGQGVGRFKAQGGVSYRGAVFYETASPMLQQLNGIAVVFEHDTDTSDNYSSKIWEWK